VLDLVAHEKPRPHRPLFLEATAWFDFNSSEYGRLFANSSASAFQHPDWLTAFYRHIAPAHGAEPLVITGRNGQGELQLVIPLVRRDSGDAAGLIEYAFLGVTDYACPVIARSMAVGSETVQALRQVLGAHAGLTIGPVHRDHLSEWRSLLAVEPSELDFGAHAVRYGFPYGPWRRRNLGSRRIAGAARKARSLARAGPVQLDLVEPADVRQAITTARDFRIGRFPGDPLQTGHGLEFYIDVATSGARSGLARTYRLTSGGGLVAVVFGLIDGDCFHYILLACDYAHYARYSPGLLVLDQVMAEWASGGGEVFDFTIGDEPFKAGFGCTRTSMHEFRL
jgi:CelD/BcsL family acetyltransferase involved in cellulose biosynthesis